MQPHSDREYASFDDIDFNKLPDQFVLKCTHACAFNQIVKDKKTYEETLSYIKCMTLNNVDDNVYLVLPDNVIREINEYVETDQTATWFSEDTSLNGKSKSKETVTSELIYYWMNQNQIPWDAERWHLNRLMKLIELTSYKNTPPEKRSKQDIAKSRREENARRRALWNTKG